MSAPARYTDLSIHLRVAWSRQHILNGGPPAATVPGWFLRVSRNEGHEDILPECWLAPGVALQIAVAIDRILAAPLAALDMPRTVLADATVQANNDMNAELRRQLEAAEASAARIPALRDALRKAGE